MSKGVKTALIVVAVLACLCTLAGGATFYFGRNLLGNALVTDSAQAAKVGAEIASYEKPDGYKEQMAMNIAGVKMVIMVGASDNGVIMMMQAPAGTMSEADLKARMTQSFNQSMGRNNVKLTSTGSQDVVIKGQTVKMEMAEGTNDKGVKIRQGIAMFDGNGGGPTVLMMMGSEADWTPEKMDAFLASIK